jgi:hypothetical protein
MCPGEAVPPAARGVDLLVGQRCLRGAGPTDEHGEQGVIVDDDHRRGSVLLVAKVRIVSHDAGDGRRVGPVAPQLQDRVCNVWRDLRPVRTGRGSPELPCLGDTLSGPGYHIVQLGAQRYWVDRHATQRYSLRSASPTHNRPLRHVRQTEADPESDAPLSAPMPTEGGRTNFPSTSPQDLERRHVTTRVHRAPKAGVLSRKSAQSRLARPSS